MAFPTLDSVVAVTGITTAAADPTINVAAAAAGKLWIQIFTATITHNNPSVPSGHTFLISTKPAGDLRSGDRDQIAYKNVLTGSEGSTLQINTAAAAVKYQSLSLLISGQSTIQAPEITATAAVGTSTQPNPPSLTPTGGAKDYLWIAVGMIEGVAAAPSTAPTNYAHPGTFTAASTGGTAATNGRMCIATRSLNAASEDPGAWGAWGASEDWVAFTIAVHPINNPFVNRIYPQVIPQ